MEPEVLRLSDLLDEKTRLQQQETADATALDAIRTCSLTVLRPKLLSWVEQGMPNAWSIFSIPIKEIYDCSDGSPRTLAEYIEFCSGKTIQEHTEGLQARLPDIQVGFVRTSTDLHFVVTKID